MCFDRTLAGATIRRSTVTSAGGRKRTVTMPPSTSRPTSSEPSLVSVSGLEGVGQGGDAARGLRAANGSEMLIAQAAIAFERWTGIGGMADVMRTAVAPLLADPTVVA